MHYFCNKIPKFADIWRRAKTYKRSSSPEVSRTFMVDPESWEFLAKVLF